MKYTKYACNTRVFQKDSLKLVQMSFIPMAIAMFHMKHFTSPTQKIGEIGEGYAQKYLVKHGFKILDRNFTHKLGEIDIIAYREGRIHFFEVKTIERRESVTRETFGTDVSRVTDQVYNPFQNITVAKIGKLARTAEIYLARKGFRMEDQNFSKNNVSRETKQGRLIKGWQIDGIGITIDHVKRHIHIQMISNIAIF